MLLASLLLSCLLRFALYASLAPPIANAQNTTTTTTTTKGPSTTSSSGTTTTPTPPSISNQTLKLSPISAQLVTSSNDFAVSLYKALGDLSPGENLFLSPLTISHGLSMLYAAAGGQTRTQLATAMRLAANTDPKTLGKDFHELIDGVNLNATKYTLHLAACLFVKKNFKIKEAFMKVMNESFGMAVENLDFDIDPETARKRINGWVASRTSGKISDVFAEDSISKGTTFVMANAAFFKGFWLYAFDKNSTKSSKFSESSSRTTTAKMMKQQQSRDLNYYNSTELGCQVLELPYEGLYASMYVFLPHDVDGLASLETRLTPTIFSTVLSSLKEEQVIVSLPKFSMDRGTSIMQALGKLGVADLFDSAKADLSGLDGSKRKAMADIVHKAYVSVDEDGKVSAAMPAMGIILTIESVRFNANRPFLFAVTDKQTGSILFMGRVIKPQKQ